MVMVMVESGRFSVEGKLVEGLSLCDHVSGPAIDLDATFYLTLFSATPNLIDYSSESRNISAH